MKRSEMHRPKLVTATVDLGDGDVLNIVFDRNKVTPAWIAEQEQGVKVESDVFAIAGALAQVIDSWDLYEDDGVTLVPVTPQELGSLSFNALAVIMEALAVAASPSRAEGNGSSEPHSMPPGDSTEQLPMPQNGLAASPSQTPSASPSPT